MQGLPVISCDDDAYLRNALRDALLEGSLPADLRQLATLEIFAGDTCLHYAALRCDIRSLSLLLQLGADPNKRGDMGATPLHNAYQSNCQEAIKLLLAARADPSMKDDFGKVADRGGGLG